MIDTQTIDAIGAHLDEHPTDWVARLELADLHEDAGDLFQARLQRWLAQHQRSPFRLEDDAVIWWQWFRGFSGVHDRHAALGKLLYSRLPDTDRSWGYSERQEAEQALLVVLTQCGWPAMPLIT